MKPKSSQGNLSDEVVDCQQEQRQWGFALRSHRPCLKMTGYLFVIALPCDSVFSFNHALLTENKDSVNGTGLGFMVWGEALKALWSDTQSIWRSFCFAVITSQDEKWNGIRKANYKTDGLASAAEHVRYAIILGSWSKLFRVCLPWSMCTLSVQHRFTDEVHFLKEMEWRYNKKTSCRLQQDALGSAKDNGRPINGLPILLHLFHQSLYLLTFDVFWLFHKKKKCGQMVGLPVTFYFVWKHTLPFLRSCSTRWSPLFKSASFWSFCRVSSVFSTREA